MKFTLFKNSKSKAPLEEITIEQFVQAIRTGRWKKVVAKLRDTPKESRMYKVMKHNLPAVTVSGSFKTRDEKTPLTKRLKAHTGLIAIDVDKKDNPLLKPAELTDKDSFMEFVSCSGEGKKLIYKCEQVTDPAVHRRIFDAIIKRLEDKGLAIKADPIVKSIASLQYVSHDPALHYNPRTKLVIKPLPAIKRTEAAKAKTTYTPEDVQQLEEFIEALGDRDITSNYEDWMIVMFGISYSMGEAGRKYMHEICKNYSGYSEEECNEKYDACLERNVQHIAQPVTLASVYQLINNALPKVKLRHLAKKFSKSHAVGQAEDVTEEQGDLNGLVRYRLFLFKKLIDKETGKIGELVPYKLNLNNFEQLLRDLGFYRYESQRIKFVRIVDNIVEQVDVADILRILTSHIEKEGDYNFVYRNVEYQFSWEEIIHLWREIRAYSNTWNQIAASLTHWEPNLLKDTPDTSYIPYRNGVVTVTAKTINITPYSQLRCTECKLAKSCVVKDCKKPMPQIWKERILDRDFIMVKDKGMFEEFFINVCGRGKDPKEKERSAYYKRACWYFGYMLQGIKRKSIARAWLLYDIKVGNSGRSGKSILGEAVGKIRSMVTIDGKQFDIKNRFAFQVIQPWTDVVFIDDPSKYMSIVPLFNMISGTLYADRKGIDPLVKSVKFMFASNWILEAEGASEIGRQFVTQLDDFYVRYGRENKDSITPVVDYHGKEFFTDWDKGDWGRFDSFCMRCLQLHLGQDAPENAIIGNANQIRFIQLNEEEMFFELCNAFISNVRKGKDGALLIPQAVLVSVIKESNIELKHVKAGKVARDFLMAIGAKHVEMSSMVVGNITRMAYKVNQNFEDLDLGIAAGKFGKPKF